MNRNLFHIGANAPTLAAALDRPANLFTPVRLILALGVLIGHLWVVTGGSGKPEPIQLFQMTISYTSVNGFFILSGLLIARSIDRNPDLIRYFTARLLRIYPALILMTASAAFVFGPIVSTLSPASYYANPGVWTFLANYLGFADTSGGPPQVFVHNPVAHEWSNTVWTLRYEIVAYMGTALLGVLGLNRNRTIILALLVTSVSLFAFVRLPQTTFLPHDVVFLTRFSTTYLLGSALYAWRDHIRLSWTYGLGIMLVGLMFGPTSMFEIMLNFMLAAGILLIGFAPVPHVEKWARIPDISYGVYIWQWPIMQALWHFGLARDPLHQLVFAFPLTVLVGLASWYGLEKPMLAHKNPVSNWLHARIKVRKTAR